MICHDILDHYDDKVADKFKGMIVTTSRDAAVKYKKQLDRLNGPESAVIISGDHNDREELKDYTLDEDELNEISKEISDRDNEYLNESDHKIIDFFSNEANQPGIKEVINISGVLTNVLGLVDEMDIKSYCLTPNIESTAYFWVYLNIYELILDTLS
ncbi:type I site-specific deoxyribonuclease, HsdR family protein [Candidatus Haloredivivus sp. G17]|nr:type I site-specific deoxyribonuclease, HsdR family protein [Candidatus Haloredivivus sp. G17]